MSAEATSQMTCKEFVELVTDLIEGQLAEARRVEAEAHLGGCDGCETYLEQIRLTIAALRTVALSEDFAQTREQAVLAFRELKPGGGGAAQPG